jgi:HNH endonuclease
MPPKGTGQRLSNDERVRIDALLTAGGIHAEGLKALLFQALRHWLDQCFVVQSTLWQERSDDDSLAFEHLRTIYGPGHDWDSLILLDTPAVNFFRAINADVHSTARTEGAAALKHLVISEQCGDFCAMCGDRGVTVVDHIVPVHRAGDPDALRNLQLLCIRCNSAKVDLPDDLLPACLTTSRGAVVSERTRFKALLDSARSLGARSYGNCACGRTAADGPLTVEPASNTAAANILTISVRCNMHSREAHE